jgi:23S rRNA pseudouridine1911/1915/1917 synthase
MTSSARKSDGGGRVESFTIPETYRGQRLDKALADLLPDFSRNRLQTWLRDGHIRVDDETAAPRMPVRGGERVVARLEAEPATPQVAPEPIALDIVYQDADLLVVNKPAGLVVHPGAGNRDGTLQNALLHHAPELAALPRSGIVHRLDKDTSGLLVVARGARAHKHLVAALAAREIEREYEAVVYGVLTAGGTVDAPIGRHPADRKRMDVREGAREAVTHYRVIRRFRAHTHVRLTLESGRTHQIRVHMRHIRHPLVGDPVYGRRLAIPAGAGETLAATLRGFRRQALHARRLALTHPADDRHLEWQAPAPPDFTALLTALSNDEESINRGQAPFY